LGASGIAVWLWEEVTDVSEWGVFNNLFVLLKRSDYVVRVYYLLGAHLTNGRRECAGGGGRGS